MSREWKTVRLKTGQRLHVEIPLGIVNITAGLLDFHGRRVDSIAVIPDGIIGQKKIVRRGLHNTRLVELKEAKT